MSQPAKKSWMERLAYNLGKTIHEIKAPVAESQTATVNKTVEEKQLDATTTLRRTVIEEIEIKHPQGQPPSMPQPNPGQTQNPGASDHQG